MPNTDEKFERYMREHLPKVKQPWGVQSLADAHVLTTIPDFVAWVRTAGRYYLEGSHLRNFNAYSDIELSLAAATFVGTKRSGRSLGAGLPPDTDPHSEFAMEVVRDSIRVYYETDDPELYIDFTFCARQIIGGDFRIHRLGQICIPLNRQTGIAIYAAFKP